MQNFNERVIMQTTYDYTIGAHFASAIVNGDYSGLEDNEGRQFDQFMAALPNHYHYKTKKIKNFDLVDYEQEPNFDRCDITGLYSDCLHFRLTYF
jgi:hypothetical protein